MSGFSDGPSAVAVSSAGSERDVVCGEANLADIEALMHAHRQLQEQYQRCSRALATAAHDLRTPLAVVSGYIELLLSGKLGPLTDRQKSCLDDMQSSSLRLQRLITDFVTFSALQTGNITLHCEEGDLNA